MSIKIKINHVPNNFWNLSIPIKITVKYLDNDIKKIRFYMIKLKHKMLENFKNYVHNL